MQRFRTADEVSDDDLMTPAEVRAYLRAPAGTVAAWVHRGVLPIIRIAPRTWRMRRGDLRQWLAERTGGRCA